MIYVCQMPACADSPCAGKVNCGTVWCARCKLDPFSLVLVQLADRGGLPVLVSLSETDDAWLRDLRAASMRCMALLSTADALKLRLADAGALPLLCTAGKPSLLAATLLCLLVPTSCRPPTGHCCLHGDPLPLHDLNAPR